jgi:hypothetical protein
MTDVLVYWRDYKQNWIRQHAGEWAWFWHSNSKVLGELQPGDRLWLVTSGESVQAEAKQAGFLVAIWKATTRRTRRTITATDSWPTAPSRSGSTIPWWWIIFCDRRGGTGPCRLAGSCKGRES